MLLRRIALISLILFLFFIQYRLWFDSDGLIEMQHLKKQLSMQTRHNKQLKQRNDDLFQQIQAIQSNPDAIEARARQELGMIKKGEIFYQIIE